MTKGADLLDEVLTTFQRFVIFQSEHDAVACTLHTAATHAQIAWDHATRLVIKSPQKRCGKSRLQDIHMELGHRAISTSNISVAALVHSITADDAPTVYLDEADTIFGAKAGSDHEDLRGILNAGFQRGRPYIRHDPRARKNEALPTFCMAVIAGIGDMPDTVEDRAVVIRMRRRAPDEKIKPYRIRRDRPGLMDLQTRLHFWVEEITDALMDVDTEPDLPVDDREADKWEPLIAIADAAGGDWPDRAREACKHLCGAVDDVTEPDVGVRLLRDIFIVFNGDDRLSTDDLLTRLYQMPESCWNSFANRSGHLENADLADLLRPYDVRPGTHKFDGRARRGYLQSQFTEAWSRYCGITDPVASGVAPEVAALRNHIFAGEDG